VVTETLTPLRLPWALKIGHEGGGEYIRTAQACWPHVTAALAMWDEEVAKGGRRQPKEIRLRAQLQATAARLRHRMESDPACTIAAAVEAEQARR
jgi:hypothetical protein